MAAIMPPRRIERRTPARKGSSQLRWTTTFFLSLFERILRRLHLPAIPRRDAGPEVPQNLDGSVHERPSAEAASLLLSQAQMFTQAEEARFVAAQGRAATLLALAGVIAGIAAGIIPGLTDRNFEPSWLGVAALLSGVIALWFFGGAVFIAVGVLQQSPDGSEGNLREVFDRGIAQELNDAAETANSLLLLCTALRGEAQRARVRADAAFAEAGRRLALSIFFVVVFAVIAYFGTEATPEQVFVGAKVQSPPPRSATLNGWLLDRDHSDSSIRPSRIWETGPTHRQLPVSRLRGSHQPWSRD